MDKISTTSIYNGSASCRGCAQPLTPVEVLWGREGLCGDCRGQQMQDLMKNFMAPGRRR